MQIASTVRVCRGHGYIDPNILRHCRRVGLVEVAEIDQDQLVGAPDCCMFGAGIRFLRPVRPRWLARTASAAPPKDPRGRLVGIGLATAYLGLDMAVIGDTGPTAYLISGAEGSRGGYVRAVYGGAMLGARMRRRR